MADITQQNTSIINTGKIDDNAAMTEMWGLNPAIIQEINKSAMVRSSKHGMFASVPIMCKGVDCAYRETCTVDPANRVLKQRCPMEIGAIVARFNYWCAHFGLDTTGDTIKEEEAVDASLIRDLVNWEVQMIRCENKIAISGDFMGKTLLDIDKKCKPYYGDIVSPETEHLMALQDKKIKILNQLNATRKDKAHDRNNNSNPTETAIRIFQEVQEAIKKQNIIDLDDMDFSDAQEVNFNDENETLNGLIEPNPVEEE
jgi:hypothetical protein